MSNLNSDIMAREFPWIKVKPIVGDFDLISVDDFLLENTVSVSKTVAPRREVQGSQTIEEASSKAAQATIAQGGITFLADYVFNAETKVGETSYDKNQYSLQQCSEEGAHPWLYPLDQHSTWHCQELCP